MKTWRALGTIVFGGLALLACDNKGLGGDGGAGADATGPTSSSSSSSGGGGATALPAPPDGPPGDASAPLTLAISHIYFGTKTVQGTITGDAWADFGLNLDGLETMTDFSQHCMPNSGASPEDKFMDGSAGRDNSWGHSLLPLMRSAAGSMDLEMEWNAPIESGQQTLLLRLPDLGSGSNYAPLSAFGLVGENESGGAWQFAPETLNGATPEASKMTFAQSYLANDTLVARGGLLYVGLDLNGTALELQIHDAIVTATLSPDHQTTSGGMIGGVLDTEEFVAELKYALGAFSPDLCQGGAAEGILNQIRQASDILVDGTQDPTKVCDGISIGLGFEASATNLGSLAAAAPPQPDPCAP